MINYIKEAKYYYILAFKKYLDIKGKSTRKEFWYFFLVNVLFAVFFKILDTTILTNMPILSTIYYYITIIPNLTVSIRRLHDINKSGYYILLNFIPVVIIILGILLSSVSTIPEIIVTYTLLLAFISLLIITSLLYYWFSLPSVEKENIKKEKLENNEIKTNSN